MAAAAGTLAVNLTAVDRLSAPLAKINTGVLRLAGGVGRLTGALRGGAGLDRLAAAARSAAQTLTAIVPPLTALTAAGTVAGVFRLASGFAEAGARAGRLAYRLQTTASQLTALQNAARLAGSSADDLTQGLEGLGDAVIDAVGGRDDTAVQYFRLLGIQMRDAAGNARTATDVLPEVADGISRIADPRLQARVMAALRLPAGLLPFLRRGAEGIREWEEEARRTGTITDEGSEAARRFEEAQTKLRLAGEGLVTLFAERLAPVLVPLLDKLTEWTVRHGPDMVQTVEDLAKRFSAWVEDAGLARLGEKLDSIGRAISTVIDWMGGMETAAIALGAVLVARLVSPLTSVLGLAARAGMTAAAAAAPAAGAAAAAAPAAAAAAAPALAGAAVVGGSGYAFLRMLRQYRENNAGSPEAQRTRANFWRNRGRAGGDGDVTDEAERGLEAWREVGERLETFFGGNRLAGAAGLSAGGRAAGFGVGGTARPMAIPQGAAADRQQAAVARLVGHGWTEEQAVGIVANLAHESGQTLNHTAVGDSGRAYGLAQWHPDRQANFARWAGKDIRESSFEEQIDFINHELTQGAEQRAGAAIRASRTAGAAAFATSTQYERPRDALGQATARSVTAEQLLADMRRRRGADGAPSAGAPATGEGAGGTPPYDVRVRVTLDGPGSQGATIRTTTPDGVRVERPALGAVP
jgi:hypothetical protein